MSAGERQSARLPGPAAVFGGPEGGDTCSRCDGGIACLGPDYRSLLSNLLKLDPGTGRFSIKAGIDKIITRHCFDIHT